jgi:hypothetical protein
MKHQYFGDENDYLKYGLLRILSGHGGRNAGVCWMLTEADRSRDGRFTAYLDDPSGWRGHDPPLFDALRHSLKVECRRDVGRAECDAILPAARFHTEVLADALEAREPYFRRALESFQGLDLIFFDPDNGIEVRGTRRGAKKSSKYLYWSEVRFAFAAGHSLLIFQYYPRKQRAPFVRDLAARLAEQCGVREIHSFGTSRAVFLLAPQRHHRRGLRSKLDRVRECWAGRIEPQVHGFG